MKVVKTLTLFASAVALASAPAHGAERGKVALGQIGLSFYAVTGAVVHEVLDRLGHEVAVTEGLHEEIFPVLGRGEIDLLAAVWLPDTHAGYWQEYGDVAEEVTTLYEGARLFWAVPDYVPEDMVASVADLTDPVVAERMDKTIRGIGAGSGLMVQSAAMMDAYGLAKAGYELVPGPASEWIANFKVAYAGERWIVMPLWQPQWLNMAYDVRPLAEPKGFFGPGDRAVLVAHEDFVAGAPERALAVLGRIHLGIDAVTAMDHAVNAGGKTPRAAAKAWMAENSDVVESWFAEE